jgi:hypothetical protein
MKNKLWLLPLCLGIGLGSIYFLPSAGAVAQSAVKMNLPNYFLNWTLVKDVPTEAEIGTLSKDTEFAKARCFSAREGEYDSNGNPIPDSISLSIVLSGVDINNSIHRPERCMPAQGHNITGSSDAELTLASGRKFPATRLLSVKSQKVTENLGRESYVKYQCLTYYFFVGHDRITNGHYHRTFLDMKDRVVSGIDQRWAFVTFTMLYGKVPWIEKEISETEADQKLQSFLTQFSEDQIDWNQIKP